MHNVWVQTTVAFDMWYSSDSCWPSGTWLFILMGCMFSTFVQTICWSFKLTPDAQTQDVLDHVCILQTEMIFKVVVSVDYAILHLYLKFLCPHLSLCYPPLSHTLFAICPLLVVSSKADKVIVWVLPPHQASKHKFTFDIYYIALCYPQFYYVCFAFF